MPERDAALRFVRVWLSLPFYLLGNVFVSVADRINPDEVPFG